MKRPILWLGTALLSLPALAQNPCDSLSADFQWGNNGGDPNEIFYSANSGQGTAYLWSFGDGEFGFMPQGTHAYPGPGTYELCLTVIYFDFGTFDTCSASSCQNITIGGGTSPCEQINADFNVSTQGLTAYFYNALSSNDYTYYWSYGDGTTSFGSDPSHTYSEPGSYYACLIMWAWDDQAQDTCFADHCEWVTVQGQGDPCDSLFACFQWGTQNNVTTFYNCSFGEGGQDLSYWWTFGDGAVSDDENPVHTYPGPGTYTVCLTIWPANQSDSCNNTICNVVTIGGGGGSPCDDAQLTFGAASQGNGWMIFSGNASPPAAGYQWFFGDGTSEIGGLFADHQYDEPGSYNACLVAWYWDEDTEDTCWVETCQWIFVPGESPCDSLFACFNYASQNNVVMFDNCSFPGDMDVNYLWDFGDGTFGDGENPVHTYPLPGEYYVCLTIYFNNGIDSCSNTVCEWVNANGGSPCDNAELSFTSQQQGGGIVVFYGSAAPPAGNYQWFFGDGNVGNGGPNTQHWYEEPGVYNVCLVGWYWNDMTQDSCAVEYCDEILVSDGEPCDSIAACFQWGTQNNVTTFYNCSWGGGQDLIYYWSFGDGSVSDSENPVHTFPEDGTYNVCLTVWFANSPDTCSSTVCNWVTIGGGGSPCDGAQLSFTATQQGGGVVVFTGSALPPADNYQWFFGDGTNANGGLTTQHLYDEPGVYNVCLVGWYWDDMNQDSCAVEFCDEIYVPGNEPCDSISACFQWGTQNSTVTFYNCSWGGGQDLIYYWSFGDGTYSDDENPVHTYPEPGTYNTCLTVWFANFPDSCTSTICNDVVISGGGSPCDNAELSFTATQQGGGVVVFTGAASPPAGNYQWFFGDGTNASGGLTTQHLYDEPGVYNVCLVGWYWDDMNQDSCAVEFCDEIYVPWGDICDSLLQASFEFQAGNALAGSFWNTSQDGLNDVVVWWNFGDGSPIAYGSQVTHTFPEVGYYYVCMYISGWIPGTQDSCTAMVCDTVLLGISGIDDPIAGSELITWPQPFDDVLTVEGDDLQGDVRYMLTDVTGRIVATDHQQVTSRMTLDLGWLPAGHYVLHLRSTNVDAVVRVMKR